MNYPYKYIVKVFSDDQYSEAFTTFAFNDIADAEKHYIDAKESGSKVFMYRILKSDNLEL